MEFLGRVTHPRFLELQKATGAFQGADRPPNRNQFLDAFHIWSAEVAEADYLLTLDAKMVRLVTDHPRYPPKVPCTTPGALVRRLDATGVFTWRDVIPYLRDYLRQVRHPRTDHPLESLVEMTQHLDRAERMPRWRRWLRRRQ